MEPVDWVGLCLGSGVSSGGVDGATPGCRSHGTSTEVSRMDDGLTGPRLWDSELVGDAIVLGGVFLPTFNGTTGLIVYSSTESLGGALVAG